MGEIKSVKVDNWGVFFLQKLQNFFNKTDYCDLTLQFKDNSQLKVHRLVLSACTDYFNVLEQTCDIVDEALIMPNELQADVVVPIVNFMYTGTLEFELKMYGKLLRTAKEMNMTVLLKLLEAHRRTMEGVNRSQRPPSPKTIRRRGAGSMAASQSQMQRRILTSANLPQQRRGVSIPNQCHTVIGSSSIQRPSNINIKSQSFKQEFDDFKEQEHSISTFEQLRKGYSNNKRPASGSFVSPPAKKPNIEDVKEFAEQQRMRKQIAAEFGDDQEYEGMLDDDIHNYDDDDDGLLPNNNIISSKLQQQDSESCAATITFRKEQNDKPPTIVVRDSANSNMNHAKIIQEVLRQYPHLVKGNKNIKLKIMPNVVGQAQKIIVKKESVNESDSNNVTSGHVLQKSLFSPSTPVKIEKSTFSPKSKINLQKVSSAISGKPLQIDNKKSPSNIGPAPIATGQKRRIDSKTMHALIALGAENINGPWLCLRCGINGRPISIPSYRGFRRHLINTHKEVIDPDLCEHCGWRSSNSRQLHFHVQIEHKIKSTLYSFVDCQICEETFIDSDSLDLHISENHPDKNKQQCIYCNRVFQKEIQLYTHMKINHKKQALEDGIIDFSDEEFLESHSEFESDKVLSGDQEKKDSKIKIISDISLPVAKTILKLEPSSEAAALSTVATGIATSIGLEDREEFIASSELKQSNETKFINADGNEMLLTEEQRKGIISQLTQEKGNDGGLVMVLNEPIQGFHTETTVEFNASVRISKNENESNDRIANENENLNEVRSCKELQNSNRENRLTATDNYKESLVHMEWAETLVSTQELSDGTTGSSKKSNDEKIKVEDDIRKKLKELTGDWSEDEIEDGEIEKVEFITTVEQESHLDEKQKSILNTTASVDIEKKPDEDDLKISRSDEVVEESKDKLESDVSVITGKHDSNEESTATLTKSEKDDATYDTKIVENLFTKSLDTTVQRNVEYDIKNEKSEEFYLQMVTKSDNIDEYGEEFIDDHKLKNSKVELTKKNQIEVQNTFKEDPSDTIKESFSEVSSNESENTEINELKKKSDKTDETDVSKGNQNLEMSDQ